MMHEIIHIIGLCPDSLLHIDLIDLMLANYQTNTYINLKQTINYVTKRFRSRKVTTN